MYLLEDFLTISFLTEISNQFIPLMSDDLNLFSLERILLAHGRNGDLDDKVLLSFYASQLSKEKEWK
jgi:hypothetical protein